MLEFAILGPLEVRHEGRLVDLGGARRRAALAALLLRAGEPISTDLLIHTLWGEKPPPTAAKAVHIHISRLRAQLGAAATRLVTTPAGYRLDVDSDELDARRFERLCTRAREERSDGHLTAAAATLDEALALWRGPVLADLRYEAFVQGQIAQLEEQRWIAIEERLAAELDLGHHAAVLGDLERLGTEAPLRERLVELRMRALYGTGQHVQALAAYRALVRRLDEELGLSPGLALRELEHAILIHAERLRGPAPGIDPDDGPSVLPVPPTATVGRAEDVQRLRAMIAESGCRLVTVTGAGGVGKTRLAIQTAHAMMDDFADGARFVGLAPVVGAENVPTAIAAALGVDLGSGQPVEAALVRHLARRELLLVIDNFEHVLEAAPLIADLVSGTASLTALVTSREPLHLRAERIFELSPLELPATDCDDPDELQLAPAVTLFAAAAQARDPSFAVTGTNAHDVNALCRRLDGLPLALELAAGRMRLLSPRDLAVALERSLTALDAGPRDAPPRQRGLHATLEWSHDLLSDAEQTVLAQIAVFAGGASLEAAGAVTVGTLGEFESLVEKNLVRATQGLARERRIAMLETVRTFATQKLEDHHDAEATRHRHCEYFLAVAERSALEMRRSMSSRAAAPFQADIDNFRAALTWSLSRRQPEMALRLAVALSAYWVAHDWREGARWVAAALALEPDTSPAVRAKALTERAFHLSEPGTFGEAELAARKSLEIHEALGDTAGMSASLTAVAWVLNAQNRHRDATGPAAAAARCAREVDDPVLLAHALGQQAWAAPTLDETLDLGAEAVAEYRAMGNLFEVSRLQSGLSYDALCHGADEVALRMAEDAQQAAREIRNVRLTVSPRGNEGLAALLLGDLDRATEAFRYELAVGHERAIDIVDLYEGITGLAAVCAALGRDEFAARLCGAADVTPRESRCAALQERLDERFFAPARMRSGAEAWQAAYDVGRGVPLSDAVAFALKTAALSRDDRPGSPV